MRNYLGSGALEFVIICNFFEEKMYIGPEEIML